VETYYKPEHLQKFASIGGASLVHGVQMLEHVHKASM
jgi:hypothetical protein